MGGMSTPSDRGVAPFVSAMGGAGVLAAGVVFLVGPRGPLDLATVAALFAAMVVSISVPLRLQRRGETAGFTLEEAVFVAALFVLPWGTVPALVASAALVGHALRRTDLIKVVFNVGQVGLWSAAATAVFALIGPEEAVLEPRSLLAVLSATAVVNLTNVGALAELFRRLHGRSRRETFRDLARLHAVMWLGNTSFGLLLAFVFKEDPFAAILASTLMIGLYLGYRGYAGALEERERNDRLHDVTQTLASATGSADALGRFLQQLAELFGGERAEIVVIVRDAARYLRVDADGQVTDRTGEDIPRTLDEALHGGRALLHSEMDADANHRDALAAPLILEDKTLGAVAVYDRHGLEPWDANDVKLLATLANEAAVAVKNVELVSELSEETRKLGNIVTAASDGIALVDGHGRVVTWNPAFERMTGRRSGDVIGRPWDAALEAEDERSGEQLRQAMATVLTGRDVDLPVDLHIVRAPAELRWLRCTFAPVDPDDGGEDTAGAVLIARDVTREHEAEELKSDFIATVSHELRTPLTPLKGFLATAEEHWDSLEREQLREMLASMRRQVDRLEALIADLLVVADLERPGTSLQHGQVDLTTMVERLARGFPDDSASRLRVVTDGAVHGVGDPEAAERVVRALVDNALKHTAGTVTVGVTVEDADALVRVSDQGPGIREWEREVIFERFGRLGNHLTRSQGPGLGLAIARSLAERLGGRLELESEVGIGSTFVMALPRSSPEAVRVSIG